MRRLRSLKVVAGGVLMLVILAGAELSQALAEGFLIAEENHMTGLVNEHRAAHGQPGLRQDPALQMVARRQAQRMSAAGYIYHNPNLGAEAGSAVPNWVRIGENVGVGPSVVGVEDAFLASPPHHANIDKQYNLIGLGAVASGDGALYFTQNYAQTGAPVPPPPAPLPAARPAPPPPPPTARGRAARARRAPRRRPGSSRAGVGGRRTRRTRVRGIELVQPTPDLPGQSKSEVSFSGTIVGMLQRAGGKLRFWE
jgi:hypothetical protein